MIDLERLVVYGLSVAIALGAIAVSIHYAHGADITLCREQRSNTGKWWAYREVGGKRCWYEGAPGRAKNLLQWPEPAVTPRVGPAAVERPRTESAQTKGPGPSSADDECPPGTPPCLVPQTEIEKERGDEELAFSCCWPNLAELQAELDAERPKPFVVKPITLVSPSKSGSWTWLWIFAVPLIVLACTPLFAPWIVDPKKKPRHPGRPGLK